MKNILNMKNFAASFGLFALILSLYIGWHSLTFHYSEFDSTIQWFLITIIAVVGVIMSITRSKPDKGFINIITTGICLIFSLAISHNSSPKTLTEVTLPNLQQAKIFYTEILQNKPINNYIAQLKESDDIENLGFANNFEITKLKLRQFTQLDLNKPLTLKEIYDINDNKIKDCTIHAPLKKIRDHALKSKDTELINATAILLQKFVDQNLCLPS